MSGAAEPMGIAPRRDYTDVIGDIPPVCYRAYARLADARDFVERGRIRLSLLSVYRAAETAHLRTLGRAEATITRPPFSAILGDAARNPFYPDVLGTSATYLLSLAAPPGGDARRLPPRLGQHVVRVRDPQRLARDIGAWLLAEGKLGYMVIVAATAVRYSDATVPIPPAGSSLEEILQSCGTKPLAFADEHELRLVVVTNLSRRAGPPPPAHHAVELGPLDYAEIV